MGDAALGGFLSVPPLLQGWKVHRIIAHGLLQLVNGYPRCAGGKREIK
jgi:hypothetical protein